MSTLRHCDHIKDKFRDFVSLSRQVHQLDVGSFLKDSMTLTYASQKGFLHGVVLLTGGNFKIIAGEYKNSWGSFGIPRIEGELKKIQGGLKNSRGAIPRGLLQRGLQLSKCNLFDFIQISRNILPNTKLH